MACHLHCYESTVQAAIYRRADVTVSLSLLKSSSPSSPLCTCLISRWNLRRFPFSFASDHSLRSVEVSFLVLLKWSAFAICQNISVLPSVSFFLHPLLNLQLRTLFSPGDSFLVLLRSAFEVCWISFLPPFSSFRCCITLLDSILSSKTTVFSEYACTPVFQYCVFVFGSVVRSCAMVSVGTRSRASFFLP